MQCKWCWRVLDSSVVTVAYRVQYLGERKSLTITLSSFVNSGHVLLNFALMLGEVYFTECFRYFSSI